MSTEIKVPVLPESVADAVLAHWHKKPGDIIKQDESLVDIETDKVVLEVTAPCEGVLDSVLFPAGAVVKAQQVIGTIKSHDAVIETEEKKITAVEANVVSPAVEPAHKSETISHTLDDASSPAARKALHQHNLDARTVADFAGTERLSVEHVNNFLKEKSQEKSQENPKSIHEQAEKKIVTATVPPDPLGRNERRVPMSRLRLKIAERLVHAQHTAAMLTTFNEIDMDPVIALRAHYKEEFEKKHNIKLGFMSFFIKACCMALERFPVINASIDGGDIIYHDYCDIGVAVASERGLVVPVLRDVQNMTLADCELGVASLSKKARESSLTMQDLTGGTFTITNGGVFGSLLSTPILNPPQTAILGMHKIEPRPVVVDNQIVIRSMMYVALSYDHRLIDGADAVQFLVAVKTLLQEPERFLLDL